jgi:phosphoribosylformylglycinamidine synthase subunit PurQ / glutaminase
VKAAVIVFPGSNCDRDCKTAIERSTDATVEMVWHAETALPAGVDLVVLPGGFAYGDYLRCGAMAAQSPVMKAVKAEAERGIAVLGVCNGFQVLCEAGMLPGALLRNAGLKYVCKRVGLDVVNSQTRFTAAYRGKRQVEMTVGNGEGAYYADEATLDRLEAEGQVVFRYTENPNGSARDIAGIINGAGNVLGMMPHPDRAFEEALGSADGALLFQSVLASAGGHGVASEPVVICDYDPDWPARYEQLRALIAPVLGALATAIDHVGSTAVPGLAAKPTIDLVVRLRSAADLPAAIERLARLGYDHEGDFGIAGREAFATPAGYSTHDHHLYVCLPDWRGYDDQIAFRDHLRSHPSAARAYERLKRVLAARHGRDRTAYTNGKATFVSDVLKRAASIE